MERVPQSARGQFCDMICECLDLAVQIGHALNRVVCHTVLSVRGVCDDDTGALILMFLLEQGGFPGGLVDVADRYPWRGKKPACSLLAVHRMLCSICGGRYKALDFEKIRTASTDVRSENAISKRCII